MQFDYELGNIEIEMGTLQHQKAAFKKSHELRMQELNKAIESLNVEHQPNTTKNTEKLDQLNAILDSI